MTRSARDSGLVWVRKFQTGNLIDEIRAKGFKSVKFDDKYNYSWTIPLQ
jgi:hypothetical protein